MIKRRGSVNPKKFPAETFQLYSIPSYDKGAPEILIGSDIGSSKKIIEKNDVLLSRIVPHIRRCWVINDDSLYRRVGSGEWIIFNSDKVDPHFLKYFFVSDFFNVQFLKDLRGVGGSLLRANPEITGKIKIPLPSLLSQRRIAAILDRADVLCRRDRALLGKYDELARSVFLEMFGDSATWETKNLIELSERIQVGPFGSQLHKKDYIEGGVPLINPMHIINNKIVPSKKYSISTSKARELSKYLLETNDIIMARRGEMGRCALVSERANGWFCGTGSLFIRPNPKVNPTFLQFILSGSRIKSYLEAESKGTTMSNLNSSILKKVPIMSPPISLQFKFEKVVNNINAQKSKIKRQIEKSEVLFQSLLQRAFQGKL